MTVDYTRQTTPHLWATATSTLASLKSLNTVTHSSPATFEAKVTGVAVLSGALNVTSQTWLTHSGCRCRGELPTCHRAVDGKGALDSPTADRISETKPQETTTTHWRTRHRGLYRSEETPRKSSFQADRNKRPSAWPTDRGIGSVVVYPREVVFFGALRRVRANK
jgi:hypothetical protein